MEKNMEQIYNEYFSAVYKYLFSLTHNANLSEELTQETFLKAIEKIHTFRGESKISVWLCQIAKNLLINEQKKRKKIYLVKDEELENIEDEKEMEHSLISNEAKLNIYKKIRKLDNISKEVVYLRITGELSFREIGYILDKTENWARVTFYRAKKKIEGVD